MKTLRAFCACLLLASVAVGQSPFQVDCVPDTSIPGQSRVVCTIVMDGADASAFCGFGYESRTCGSVPGVCDPDRPDASEDDPLPLGDLSAVSKGSMICMDIITDDECEELVFAQCAAKARQRGACSCDAENCTAEEEAKCRGLSVTKAVCPSPSDKLPDEGACVAVTELRLEESMVNLLAQAINARHAKLPGTSPAFPTMGGH